MTTNSTPYTHPAAPSIPRPSEHLSDEDVAFALDTSAKRSRAARKAQETMRQRRAEEQVKQEKGTGK